MILSQAILVGVVGSTAYGLAREGSDVDTLGVFVAETVDIAGLHWHSHRETTVTHEPDSTMHELGKYLRLALKGNPTILELLWLDGYAFIDNVGADLIELRHDLLSERAIRSAYGGYATAQAEKLARRGDGTFSSDTKNRSAKHARHLLRLLRQGRELLETGNLTIKVDDPAEYFAFDDMSVDQMLQVYYREIASFNAASCVLPDVPNMRRVDEFLATIRRTFI